MLDNSEREFDVKEAAQFLRVSEWTVRRMLKARELGHIRRGRGRGIIKIPVSFVESYQQQRTICAQAA